MLLRSSLCHALPTIQASHALLVSSPTASASNYRPRQRLSPSLPTTPHHALRYSTTTHSSKPKTKSSKAWLARQAVDPHVRARATENYRARSAFKLHEIEERFHFLRKVREDVAGPGSVSAMERYFNRDHPYDPLPAVLSGNTAVIVDLGAAPGGWSQVVAREMGWAQQEEQKGPLSKDASGDDGEGGGYAETIARMRRAREKDAKEREQAEEKVKVKAEAKRAKKQHWTREDPEVVAEEDTNAEASARQDLVGEQKLNESNDDALGLSNKSDSEELEKQVAALFDKPRTVKGDLTTWGLRNVPIVAIDLRWMEPIPGVHRIHGDFLSDAISTRFRLLLNKLNVQPAAPPTNMDRGSVESRSNSSMSASAYAPKPKPERKEESGHGAGKEDADERSPCLMGVDPKMLELLLQQTMPDAQTRTERDERLSSKALPDINPHDRPRPPWREKENRHTQKRGTDSTGTEDSSTPTARAPLFPRDPTSPLSAASLPWSSSSSAPKFSRGSVLSSISDIMANRTDTDSAPEKGPEVVPVGSGPLSPPQLDSLPDGDGKEDGSNAKPAVASQDALELPPPVEALDVNATGAPPEAHNDKQTSSSSSSKAEAVAKAKTKAKTYASREEIEAFIQSLSRRQGVHQSQHTGDESSYKSSYKSGSERSEDVEAGGSEPNDDITGFTVRERDPEVWRPIPLHAISPEFSRLTRTLKRVWAEEQRYEMALDKLWNTIESRISNPRVKIPYWQKELLNTPLYKFLDGTVTIPSPLLSDRLNSKTEDEETDNRHAAAETTVDGAAVTEEMAAGPLPTMSTPLSNPYAADPALQAAWLKKVDNAESARETQAQEGFSAKRTIRPLFTADRDIQPKMLAGQDTMTLLEQKYSFPRSEPTETRNPTVDVVLSDMAANMTGNRTADVSSARALAEAVLDFAKVHLKSAAEIGRRHGGVVVMKYFIHPHMGDFERRLRLYFNTVRVFKPKSSRPGSAEAYWVCMGFKPDDDLDRGDRRVQNNSDLDVEQFGMVEIPRTSTAESRHHSKRT